MTIVVGRALRCGNAGSAAARLWHESARRDSASCGLVIRHAIARRRDADSIKEWSGVAMKGT